MKNGLTNEMIKDLANRLGIEPALLKAVQIVLLFSITLTQSVTKVTN